MKNAMRATSPAIKATVFLGMATLLVAGCASKKSSSSPAPSSAAAATSGAATSAAAAAPAGTSAAAAPAPSSAAGVAPAAAGASAAGTVAPAVGVSVDVKMGPLGKYLTDATGKTLYIYTPDTSSASSCYGECIANWPAFVTNGAPQAGADVTASLLGTSARTDGTTQVTYDGHPLYLFKGDKSAGDTSGQGKQDTWFMVSGTGVKIGRAAVAPAPTKPAPTATKAAPTTAAPPTPSPTKYSTAGGWA
jgi:predicted lipoprotein with Yx(FWY)xxD motif